MLIVLLKIYNACENNYHIDDLLCPFTAHGND